MAIFEDRFIKGSRFTQHFTLDDPSDQVVPKPGTDLVPGALALNLGNNLPADTTNATDALTAAGFNAMANAVDTTDPFCGNAIQQAVTVAVGQSIACDAAAQEAIACAIASNPEAVACLAAALPSGCDDSGAILLDSHPLSASTLNRPSVPVKWENGVTTQLGAPLLVGGYGGDSRPGKVQNPGKFTGVVPGNINNETVSLAYALDTATNTYTTAVIPNTLSSWPAQQQMSVNSSGTRVVIGTDSSTYQAFNIAADGVTLTPLPNGTVGQEAIWIGEDLVASSTGTKNVVTGATSGFFPQTRAGAISSDYAYHAWVQIGSGMPYEVPQPAVWLHKLTRTGDSVTATLITVVNVTELPFPPGPVYPGAPFSVSYTWTPDSSQVIVVVRREYTRNDVASSPTVPAQAYDSMCFVVNVTPSSAAVDIGGVRPWGSATRLRNPRVSGDGKYMVMESYTGTAIFKKNGVIWSQIGLAPGFAPSTIVGGATGYSEQYNG
jgi:hypothetical protein